MSGLPLMAVQWQPLLAFITKWQACRLFVNNFMNLKLSYMFPYVLYRWFYRSFVEWAISCYGASEYHSLGNWLEWRFDSVTLYIRILIIMICYNETISHSFDPLNFTQPSIFKSLLCPGSRSYRLPSKKNSLE